MKSESGTAATFPLLYQDDDGTQYRVNSASDAQLRIEFADDADPAYSCWDSLGCRIRIIAWNLQLLVAQVIPIDFDPAMLEIHEFEANGRRVITEEVAGTALRAIEVDVASLHAMPDQWNEQPLPAGAPKIRTTRVSTISPVEFHRKWMYIRTTDRFFESADQRE